MAFYILIAIENQHNMITIYQQATLFLTAKKDISVTWMWQNINPVIENIKIVVKCHTLF